VRHKLTSDIQIEDNLRLPSVAYLVCRYDSIYLQFPYRPYHVLSYPISKITCLEIRLDHLHNPIIEDYCFGNKGKETF
jgi:hypothetical protein